MSQNRYIDKWNRIWSPDKNPYVYEQLILTRDSIILSRKLIVSSINYAGKATYILKQKNECGPQLTPFTNIILYCVKNSM